MSTTLMTVGPATVRGPRGRAERLLSDSFAPGTLDSSIAWRLEPENGGTRLHLEHAGFDLDSPLGKKAFDGMKGGWPAVLGRIAKAIESTVAT